MKIPKLAKRILRRRRRRNWRDEMAQVVPKARRCKFYMACQQKLQVHRCSMLQWNCNLWRCATLYNNNYYYNVDSNWVIMNNLWSMYRYTKCVVGICKRWIFIKNRRLMCKFRAKREKIWMRFRQFSPIFSPILKICLRQFWNAFAIFFRQFRNAK